MPPVPRASANGTGINNIAPQLLAMTVPIDSLVPDPNNSRVHPEMNMETIRKSLMRYGQVHPLVCRESTRVIIAGNGRWQAAKDLGWTIIAAHFVHLNEVDAAGLGLADNRSAELAKWDHDTVARIQRLQLEFGENPIGWDECYIAVISKMPDWNPTPQNNGDNVGDKPTTFTIKMTTQQREFIEACMAMVKGRRGSPKKMTDAQALVTLLEEWAL